MVDTGTTTSPGAGGASGGALDGAARLGSVRAVLDDLWLAVSGLPANDVRRWAVATAGVRASLDRLVVALSRQADDLTPGNPCAAEDLWRHRADSNDGDGDGDNPLAAEGDGGGSHSTGSGPDSDGAAGPAAEPEPEPVAFDPEAARVAARRAAVCRELPAVADAFDDGRISGEHLDALARVLRGLDTNLRRQFVDCGRDIATAAAGSTAHGLRVWCRDLLERLAAAMGREHAERRRRDTKLAWWTDQATGMTRLSGQFHPELGQRITTLLHNETTALKHLAAQGGASLPGWGGPEPDLSTHRDHLAAHALARLLARSSSGSTSRSASGSGAQVNVIVDAPALDAALTGDSHPGTVAEYHDGTPIDPTTLARLVCDSPLRRILLDADGVPLDVGRASRLATPQQRIALRALHRTCILPGCSVAFHDCEIHHFHPWEHGGPTDLANLAPVCTHHHHRIHDGTYAVTLHPDRSITIRGPDGTQRTHPPPDLARRVA